MHFTSSIQHEIKCGKDEWEKHVSELENYVICVSSAPFKCQPVTGTQSNEETEKAVGCKRPRMASASTFMWL